MPEFERPADWNAKTPSRLAAELLAWFRANRRPLPWRESRDPYKIWVSEVMLQQTTVAAVGPYFQRFIERFPTVNELAAAEEQEVLRYWSGLGYYRRARHLHQSAKIIVDKFPGELPNDTEFWAELPGVGRYILGAVLSQAFDRPLPIVEANSLRVLCRLFGYAADPRSSRGQKWLWQAAEQLMPAKNAGDYNQALMELGSLVCTPNQPSCSVCPLSAFCQAHKLGQQSSIPLKSPAKPLTVVREVAVALFDSQGRLLFGRRSDNAKRWAGMWELPHGELSTDETEPYAVQRVLFELTGYKAKPIGEVARVRHGITRYDVTMVCYRADFTGGRFRSELYAEESWRNPADARSLPMSSPQTKLLKLINQPNQPRLFEES